MASTKGPVTRTRAAPRARDAYRHGDLRRALVEVGVELARGGGPDAVVLRETTRRVGVVPNAAYRHFADRHALLDAVRSAASSILARAMEAELAAVAEGPDRAATARRRLRAVGTGYIQFARAEPGLFRTAFSVPKDLRDVADPAHAGASGLTPAQLLGSALDELVETGVLLAERRPTAGFLAWSAVHGLATLLVEGPLRGLEEAQIQETVRRLLDMVDQGL
jgi:AcrR family transcriptional regulator